MTQTDVIGTVWQRLRTERRMMGHRPIARPALHSFDELVLRKRNFLPYVEVRKLPGSRDINLHGHPEHKVRSTLHDLAVPITEVGCHRGWTTALRRSRIRPRNQSVDLFLSQPPGIVKLSIAWIGKPGRHFMRHHFGFDTLRPGAGLRVRRQGHRSYFPLPVTADAVGVDNRRHILIPCRSRSGGSWPGFCPGARKSPYQTGTTENQQESTLHHFHASE